MKKRLMMLCALLIVFSLASAGLTMSWFTDEAVAGDTVFTAGTVDIAAGMKCADEPNPVVKLWPMAVIDSDQGVQLGGGAILPERSIPEDVMTKDGKFFSLGFADEEGPGYVAVEFEYGVCDGKTVVVETTNGDDYPLEQAKVYISKDNENWTMLGIVDNKGNNSLSVEGMDANCARYVKLVDATGTEEFGNTADGFDVDAIKLVGNFCGEMNWNPGDTNTYQLMICNNGTKAINLRTKIVGKWYEKDENGEWIKWKNNMTEAVELEVDGSCWNLCEDGYYYFNQDVAGTYDELNPMTPLDPECLCLPVDVHLVGELAGNKYQGKKLILTTEVEAVQASNDAPVAVWGMDHTAP